MAVLTMNPILYLIPFLLLLTIPTLAAPSNAVFVAYPLAEQRPPVARVGVPFSWSILPGTFNTSNGNAGITYSISNLPTWASFSSDIPTIHGTPDGSRMGSINVVITAHDVTQSSSISDDFNLLIVDSPPPRVKLPLASQLGNGAVLGSAKYNHATNGITVPPNWSWSIGLLPDTFVTPSGAGIYYTAYEAGTTSLPSWIKFNTITATFDGVSPSEQRDVSIVVYGSDHLGYGDLEQKFTFTVTQHTFDLLQPLPPINATAQSIINYNIPFSGFNIDGAARNSTTSIIETVDLASMPFLTHDQTQHTISGTLPESLLAQTNLTIPISFTTPSSHHNISTQIILRVVPGLFTASLLPPLLIQSGQSFDLDLKQYTSNLNATYSLSQISPPEAADWIHFTTFPLTLTGTPPLGSDTPIDITLLATGLNGLRSTAELPLRFEAEGLDLDHNTHHNLSDGSKMALAIVFGTVGGIALLILIMRSCRKYCSADGMRELEEEDAYKSHYAYPGEKAEMKKPMSMKETPVSLGETFVGIHSPKWKAVAEVGGPMMAVTPNELAMSSEAHQSTHPLKRLDIFNVFTRPSRSDVVNSNSHPSLRGLGIVAPDHRVINVLASSDPSQVEDEELQEDEDEDDYDSEEVNPPVVRSARPPPGHSTDDQRSSWNTTGSSSLFYSDTQGEESEAASSSRSPKSSGKWLVKPPASVPRRRKDFKPIPQQTLKSERQSDGIDVGTIRMVVDQASGFNSDPNSSEDDAMVLSESIGAIKTASYRKIVPESLHSIPMAGSEPDSGSSLRPKLIAFKSQRVPQRKLLHLTRKASSSVLHDSVTEDAEEDEDEDAIQTPTQRHVSEADIGGSQRLSVRSVYTPPAPVNGSPATSAIFFSPPREQHWHLSPAIPSPLSTSFSAHDSQPPPSGSRFVRNGPSPHPGSTSGSSYPSSPSPLLEHSESETDPFQNTSIVVKVGIGEPFHMTPRINQPSSGAQMSATTRYFALIDLPNQPQQHRKQLPEWLHFDAREFEVSVPLRRVFFFFFRLILKTCSDF